MKEKQVKDPGLINKTALVTGASRGIGRAIAWALAETGAHVLAHYGRSAREAESLVSESKTKADAHTQSRRTWELPKEQLCSPRKPARLLATV